MRWTDDLSDPRLIYLKGWLFLVLGLLSGGALVALDPQWPVAVLLCVCVWAFCRWYYFAFYVVERYVDPSFKFAGLSSFVRYMVSRKKA